MAVSFSLIRLCEYVINPPSQQHVQWVNQPAIYIHPAISIQPACAACDMKQNSISCSVTVLCLCLMDFLIYFYIFSLFLYFSSQLLVFELPSDITTRSLSLAMLSEARMLSDPETDPGSDHHADGMSVIVCLQIACYQYLTISVN